MANDGQLLPELEGCFSPLLKYPDLVRRRTGIHFIIKGDLEQELLRLTGSNLHGLLIRLTIAAQTCATAVHVAPDLNRSQFWRGVGNGNGSNM